MITTHQSSPPLPALAAFGTQGQNPLTSTPMLSDNHRADGCFPQDRPSTDPPRPSPRGAGKAPSPSSRPFPGRRYSRPALRQGWGCAVRVCAPALLRRDMTLVCCRSIAWHHVTPEPHRSRLPRPLHRGLLCPPSAPLRSTPCRPPPAR